MQEREGLILPVGHVIIGNIFRITGAYVGHLKAAVAHQIVTQFPAPLAVGNEVFAHLAAPIAGFKPTITEGALRGAVTVQTLWNGFATLFAHAAVRVLFKDASITDGEF